MSIQNSIKNEICMLLEEKNPVYVLMAGLGFLTISNNPSLSLKIHLPHYTPCKIWHEHGLLMVLPLYLGLGEQQIKFSYPCYLHIATGCYIIFIESCDIFIILGHLNPIFVVCLMGALFDGGNYCLFLMKCVGHKKVGLCLFKSNL